MKEILLVEDNRELVQEMKSLLVRAGYSADWVRTTGALNTAIQMHKERPCGLICLDGQFPNVPGGRLQDEACLEAIRYLNYSKFSGQVIVYTSSKELGKKVRQMTVNGKHVIARVKSQSTGTYLEDEIIPVEELVALLLSIVQK